MNEQLARIAAQQFGARSIANLHRLSGGASQETWSFDAGERPLILRRSPEGLVSAGASSIGLATEAELIRLARRHGVAAPEVFHVLTEADGLGTGYIMERVAGETIARKILRDEAFAGVRPKLAHQCGEAAARIHAIPVTELPALDRLGAREQLDRYRELYDNYDYPHPVLRTRVQVSRGAHAAAG
jgi:aminoglycoside phosphotransferase (APT) family kinase protein